MNIDTLLYGTDFFGESAAPAANGPVSEKFLVPPFSVLNAREGSWQERKRAWRSLGIEGEVARDAPSIHCPSGAWVTVEEKEARKVGGINSTTGKNSCMFVKQESDLNEDGSASVTSLFDPVLCELAYRWFCPEGGQIIDPFAGGSVRGIVASKLNRKYWGCDLRGEQVAANEEQATRICTDPMPIWETGCSRTRLQNAPEADFLFSCPPYGDLEVYSDDDLDLSGMGWQDFQVAYGHIIGSACHKLRNNRFACFVVGDFRDTKTGFYRNFVGKTVEAFEYAGLELYNEAILVTSVGSASMRVTKQFEAGRKFCKTHQNVLVFCKGDWRKATEALR